MAKDNNTPDFLRDMLKEIKDADTVLAATGDSAAEYSSYIDTGCYVLNALLSGSIYGGFADNKRLVFAGESSVGKTFFALSIAKHFLDMSPKNFVFYIDTEASVTREMIEQRGIDSSRVVIYQSNTVENIRTKIMQFAKAFADKNAKDPDVKTIVIYDSLGNTSTNKEIGDMETGATTRDMTRGQLLRGMFRAITVPLARAKIPLIINNHIYQNVTNPYAGASMAGGEGARYAGDMIVYLTKAKDRDKTSNELIGNIITARLDKSRLTREGAKVKVKLSFSTGLDKYYGLVDLAIASGIWRKSSTKIVVSDGSAVFEKRIYNNPEQFFTKEVLDQIDKFCPQLFSYGAGDDITEFDDTDADSDDLLE